MQDGHTYFAFPGDDIRAGEAPADAAVREAREELGVRVVLGPRLLIEELNGQTVHYFSALIVDGELGSGTADPVWFELGEPAALRRAAACARVDPDRRLATQLHCPVHGRPQEENLQVRAATSAARSTASRRPG